MAFKMKGSAFKLNNVATKSALKHSGSAYAAEVQKEIGKDRASKYDYKKGHDEGHATKWNSDHSDKTTTKDDKDTKASPTKQKVKETKSKDGTTTTRHIKKRDLFDREDPSKGSVGHTKSYSVDNVNQSATKETRGGKKKVEFKRVTDDYGNTTKKKVVTKWNPKTNKIKVTSKDTKGKKKFIKQENRIIKKARG